MRIRGAATAWCWLWLANGFTSPPTSSSQRMVASNNRFHKIIPTTKTRYEIEETKDAATEDDPLKIDAVICGGGPAGLLSAIMLAQKFPKQKIRVFERLKEPPSPTDDSVWSDVAKFYLIGLGSRGQNALKQFGVWKEVEARSSVVLGRKDWPPDSKEGVERIFTDRPVNTQVLPREKLVGVLHKHIMDNYADSIKLSYGFEVLPINFEAQSLESGDSVLLRVSKCEEDLERVNPSEKESEQEEPDVFCDPNESMFVSTKFLIAADGTARTIANSMQEDDEKRYQSRYPLEKMMGPKPFRIKRYVDDNQRIYKTVAMKIPMGWRFDLNYSARTKGGRVTFDALPANRNGMYCGVLLLKKEDPLAQADSDPKELRALLDDTLPEFSALLDDETVATIAKKPPSFLPAFRYAGPRLNQGGRTVILGDCAHTVKPYFGLGANTALEDVKCLGAAIDDTETIPDAVRRFSNERAGEAATVVKLSRELDRPGKLGFITFVLPLILDSIFNGLAPKLFAPNLISMLQKEGMTFTSVARRKRADRVLQSLVITGFLTGLVVGTRYLINCVAAAMGRRSSTVLAGLASAVALVVILKKVAIYLVPGMAPADVLNKTKSKITDSERAGSFFLGRKGKKAS